MHQSGGNCLLGHAGVELERWMVTLAFAVLAVLGILVQFLMESGKRQKLHLKKLRRFANRIPQRMKWIKPELFWMKSLKKKSRQRKKYIMPAVIPHAEELEMEFEDEFEDDDEG